MQENWIEELHRSRRGSARLVAKQCSDGLIDSNQTIQTIRDRASSDAHTPWAAVLNPEFSIKIGSQTVRNRGLLALIHEAGNFDVLMRVPNTIQ